MAETHAPTCPYPSMRGGSRMCDCGAMAERFPHAPECLEIWEEANRCTCGAHQRNADYEAGKADGPRSADARAMAVVERCISDCEIEQICWFCGYARSKPPSHWHHDDDCLLVVNRWIDKEGRRL